MASRFSRTPACLCLSALLTALLMGLLNGESYADRLEAAHPSARPVAELLRRSAAATGLSALHGLVREGTDACCAALWGGAEVPAEPEAPVAPPEAAEPAPPPVDDKAQRLAAALESFRGFHMQWAGQREAHAVHEFRGFRRRWLGAPAPLPQGMADFHRQWRGKEACAPLVDSCPVSCRVMLMGDSLMEDFGVSFYRHARTRRGMQMILLAKFSTGLCRPDYFNWFEVFPRNLDEKKPHIVIFMMGANDCQPIWYSRGHVVSTRPVEAWNRAYTERVGQLLGEAQQRQVLPLWVGMPVMGGGHATILARTEELTRQACAELSVPYIDNRARLADSRGQYQSFIKNEAGQMVRVRTKDQQHMTPEGNAILVQAIMADVEKLLRLHRLNHPELCVYPGQQNLLARPSLEVLIPYKPPKKK